MTMLAGCIAGHDRTGLAALAGRLLKSPAIS